MMYLVLLVFTALINKSVTIDCQKCHNGNYRTCDDSLYIDKCGYDDSKCFSLVYTKEGSEENEEIGFKKGCVRESAECNTYCELFIKYGYTNCQISCCKGHMCNKEGIKKMFDKKKRSLAKINGASSTRYSDIQQFVLINSCFVLFLWFFTFL